MDLIYQHYQQHTD